MSFDDLRKTVLDHDLCTRCGGCVAVCPLGVITLSAEDFLPLFTAGQAAPVCGDCTLCLDTCPGRDTGVNASEERRFGRTRDAGERWTGITRGVYEVTSRDARILRQASAGGAATSLLVAALRSGLIDAALVVGHDPQQPWRSRAMLTEDESVVIDCAAAKYSFAPNLPLLADTRFRRIGMVGLPCQIEAVNKMHNMAEVPEAGRRVTLTIELACASATRPEGTRHVIEQRLGITVDNVESLSYRDGLYPGNFTVRTRDGRTRTYPFFEMVKEFTKFKTFRCDACPDWWSGIADVSVADGDPNIFATSQRGTAGRPRSAVVVRTQEGERLLAAAAEQRLVHVSPHSFDPSASLGLQRKRHRYTRIAREAGRVIPAAPAHESTPVLPKSDEDLIAEMSEVPCPDE